jgi:hypothetical protein
VQRVISTALDKHQVTHVVVLLLLLLNLLSAGGDSILESIVLLLFLVRVLNFLSRAARFVALLITILRLSTMVTIFKGKHLARLIIIKHVLMMI